MSRQPLRPVRDRGTSSLVARWLRNVGEVVWVPVLVFFMGVAAGVRRLARGLRTTISGVSCLVLAPLGALFFLFASLLVLLRGRSPRAFVEEIRDDVLGSHRKSDVQEALEHLSRAAGILGMPIPKELARELDRHDSDGGFEDDLDDEDQQQTPRNRKRTRDADEDPIDQTPPFLDRRRSLDPAAVSPRGRSDRKPQQEARRRRRRLGDSPQGS